MFRPPFAQGLSLVELLLALALGLVVTLGLTQQYVGGRGSASSLMGQADAQDSGRYALAFLRQSAAAAGNLGCNGRAVRLMSALNGDWDDLFEFNLPRPVQGFDYQGDGASTALDDWTPSLAPVPRQASGGTVNALARGTGIRLERLAPGADIVVFRRLQQPVFALAAELAADGEPVVQNSADGRLRAGDVAVVSNCEQAAMFRITVCPRRGQVSPFCGVLRAAGRTTTTVAAASRSPARDTAAPTTARVRRSLRRSPKSTLLAMARGAGKWAFGGAPAFRGPWSWWRASLTCRSGRASMGTATTVSMAPIDTCRSAPWLTIRRFGRFPWR